MRTLSLIHVRTGSKSETDLRQRFLFDDQGQNLKAGVVREFPRRTSPRRTSPLRTSIESGPEAPTSPLGSTGLMAGLSADALSVLRLIGTQLHYPSKRVLISEEEIPGSILLLLEGRVKLSINSADGRRLIIGVDKPGDILGLTFAVSGSPYLVTAEAQFPCRILSIPRLSFLEFLMRYPVASRNAARQLSCEYKRTYEQLGTLGLTLTAPAKLARLLLDWCTEGEHTIRGIRIHCSLTHGEIGECIGLSRETISRSLNEFKNKGLVEQHGSTLIVPSRSALAIFAGIGRTPGPPPPAA